MFRNHTPTAASLILAATLSAGSPLAAPPAASKLIVLESYAGAPPEDGSHYADFLVRSLSQMEPDHGSSLRTRINERMSAGAGAGESTPQELAAMVKDGRRAFIEGEYQQAIQSLDQAREQLMLQAGKVASDQTLRGMLYETLLFLTYAALRAGQTDLATERVSEAIRSFPDRDLALVKYGPELSRYYKRVRRELDQQPRGTLTIESEPEASMVFLNERFVGLSPARVPDLYPGRYRVLVQRQETRGRIHWVNVSGGDHKLTVELPLDQALQTEPYVGFLFHNPEQMAMHETEYAAEVGRAVDASRVLLLGQRKHEGRRVLLGAMIFSDTGRVIRSGMVALEPAAPSPKTLRALAQFLVAGKESDDVMVRNPGDGTVSKAPGPRRRWTSWAKWVATGAAVAAVGAGVAMFAINGQGTCSEPSRCPEKYETTALGIALTSTGGAAAIGAGYLFYRDSKTEAAHPGTNASAALVPVIGRQYGGLAAAFAF